MKLIATQLQYLQYYKMLLYSKMNYDLNAHNVYTHVSHAKLHAKPCYYVCSQNVQLQQLIMYSTYFIMLPHKVWCT